MKISIYQGTKNEYDYEWFKKNVENKNIDVKDILMYSKSDRIYANEYEVIYEDDVYYFISNGTYTYLIKKETNFKEGDKVQVVNEGYSYPWYDDWFKKYEIDATYWCYGIYPKEDEKYTIVEIRKHLNCDRILCLIEDREGKMFLIRDKGLKRV